MTDWPAVIHQSRVAVAHAAGEDLHLITPIRYTAHDWDLDRVGEDQRLGWADLGFGPYNPQDEHLPVVWRYSPERIAQTTAHLTTTELVKYVKALRRLMLNESVFMFDVNIDNPEENRLLVPENLRERAYAAIDELFPDHDYRTTINSV